MGHKRFKDLSEAEIDGFFDEVDSKKRGWITDSDLRAKMNEFYEEIAPDSHRCPCRISTLMAHHPPASKEKDLETALQHDGLTDFVGTLFPPGNACLDREEFNNRIRAWKIPSQNQNSAEEQDACADEYARHLSIRRRIRAHWSLMGPQICFVSFVVAVQVAIGAWETVKFATSEKALRAFGPGVVVAKAVVGALYPTVFFMLLSMSRWLAVFMRQWGPYCISRFVNWDHHQAFHVWMACEALLLGTVHAISHLSGTFFQGSRPGSQARVAEIVGTNSTPMTYASWLRTRPGWTGLCAIGLFWVIALLSSPPIRRRSYEIFQLSHILMFPLIGLLCAHGTSNLLQESMFGYWLVVPTLLVILERAHRIYRGFIRIPARLELLDSDTVTITARLPVQRRARFTAGQYIFLQVPSISAFQWHPFTISACRANMLQLHIKTDGNWTRKLRQLPPSVLIGLDGPFGAPSQRFYAYDRAIIIGAGIGVTPFSAIMTDLEQNLAAKKDPWSTQPQSRASSRSISRGQSRIWVQPPMKAFDKELHTRLESVKALATLGMRPSRRVDFHWIVRERNQIGWFSDLLNRAHDLCPPQSPYLDEDKSLSLNINTYITARRKAVSTHVFRYLLDRYRDQGHPVSALTGLRTPSTFERPDLEEIIKKFHRDMVRQGWTGGVVGVFFCGSPKLGKVLADTCAEMTAGASHDGSKIQYRFMTEVFT